MEICKGGTGKTSAGEIKPFPKRDCNSTGLKPWNGEKNYIVKGPVLLTVLTGKPSLACSPAH